MLAQNSYKTNLIVVVIIIIFVIIGDAIFIVIAYKTKKRIVFLHFLTFYGSGENLGLKRTCVHLFDDILKLAIQLLLILSHEAGQNALQVLQGKIKYSFT